MWLGEMMKLPRPEGLWRFADPCGGASWRNVDLPGESLQLLLSKLASKLCVPAEIPRLRRLRSGNRTHAACGMKPAELRHWLVGEGSEPGSRP